HDFLTATPPGPRHSGRRVGMRRGPARTEGTSMRRAFFAKATAALAAVGLATRAAAQAAPASAKGGRIKVVYQLAEGIDQAVRALGNLRNHLAGAPDTKLVVVALGYGVDFLVDGARDPRGN